MNTWGKTILVLKELLPDNPFLNDKDEIDLISGESFKKRCMRSQMKKSDTFGVESKIGLYRVARHGRDASGTPHWSCLINCDEICKNMMYATKIDDTYNDSIPAGSSQELKAITTLNYWGDLIRDNFHTSNPDFHKLTNESNAGEAIRVLNTMAKSLSRICNENIELRNEVKILHATIESDRVNFQNTLDAMHATQQQMHNSQHQMHKMLAKFSELIKLPPTPPSVRQGPVPYSQMPSMPLSPVTNRNSQMPSLPLSPVTNVNTTISTKAQTMPYFPSSPLNNSNSNINNESTDSTATIGIAESSGEKRHASDALTSNSDNKQMKYMVDNYNYLTRASQGTNLEDILISAYYKRHFKTDEDWSFLTIAPDPQFMDNKAKFKYCLQLFEVVASNEAKQELETTNLDPAGAECAARTIAEQSMKKLLELEDKPKKGREKRGYMGVGTRIRKLLTNKYRVGARDNTTTLAQAVANGKVTTKITDYTNTK